MVSKAPGRGVSRAEKKAAAEVLGVTRRPILRGVDRITRRWIKNENDERAAASGCYFDEAAADHFAEFCRGYCRHSKGIWAGQPFELLDWQYREVFGPLFGWKRGEDDLRRFRVAYVQIPKKNGKSTAGAAVGLYMLVADGEQGAEVYSAATSQAQAAIVHGEAVNMAEKSPELSAVLQINRTTKTISFPSTLSTYKALSKEAASSEGLNAHCIINDELHAWRGRDLWDSLKFAFAARSQPLLFTITTAGDDVTSVCFEQYEYAKEVADGTQIDERFFSYVREALPGDDIESPKTWRKANPSLGVTISERDFRADLNEAKKKPATLAAWKRYKLDIWCVSTNPWLALGAWEKCRRDFDRGELAGLRCYGGLDLAKTLDMTALVLSFPMGGECVRWLPFFWMPEGTVDDPKSPDYLRSWRDLGLLKVTPGDVCNYDTVLEDITELVGEFDLRAVAFDPCNAEQLTQKIEELGVERYRFPQTMMSFTGPTTEAERLILSGKLEHNGHKILDWQAGHVQVKSDANGNKRPVKPKHGDRKKIDGIVAGVMGLSLALKDGGEFGPSVYDSNERESGIIVL